MKNAGVAMLRQMVKDYAVIEPLALNGQIARGFSLAPTWLLPNILPDNSVPVSLLDIGFGAGGLGELIKSRPETAHWSVDGVDGFAPNCNNAELFGKKIYRNVWHGLAQEIPYKTLSSYKIICLLDVIEHLRLEDARLLIETLLGDMGNESRLFVSTPLYFCPQDSQQEGDLEEHLIGVPAAAMLGLKPLMYSISDPMIGGFVFGKQSADHVDAFVPTTDRAFDLAQGTAHAQALGLALAPGEVYRLNW
jgi:hypothetical protein